MQPALHGDQVRRAFLLYDTDPNASIPYVAQQTGIPISKLTEILRNPVYAGNLGFRRRSRNPDGTKTRLPRSAWRMIPAKGVEPLIPFELWERVQDLLQRQRWIAKPGGLRWSIFHGLCYCGTCGGQLVRVSSGGSGRKAPDAAYYRCNNRAENRTSNHVAIRQDHLTAAVLAEVDRLYRMDHIWQEAMAARSTLDATAEEESRRVKADLTRVDRQISNLVDQLADGRLAEVIQPKLLALIEERKTLQERQSELANRSARLDQDLDSLRKKLASLRIAFEAANWEERCELMRLRWTGLTSDST